MKALDRMEMGVMEAPGPERFVQVRIWGQESPYEIVLGNFAIGTDHFSAGDVNKFHNYGADNMVAGNPAQITESARAYYNSLIYDDVQMVPYSTSGLPATAPVIGPGAAAKTFAALLTTIPQGDDVVNAAGDHILAGPNGIADTRANHDQVDNFPLQLNSAWINPERNERVDGVVDSRHQFGGAVDLKIVTVPTGYTLARAYCVLEKVGDTYFGKGISEKNSSQRLCTDGDVTHVHIQN